VVLRYRSYLSSRPLAPGTVNLRLGAVRRLAYEAADSGLLSSDLAAGIRRVKGVRNLGVRLGNWLTVEQSLALWRAPDGEKLKGKRDRALLALLLACGLRRHEAVGLRIEHLEQREEHWAIVDPDARLLFGSVQAKVMTAIVTRRDLSMVWNHGGQVQVKSRANPRNDTKSMRGKSVGRWCWSRRKYRSILSSNCFACALQA
jgi:site-specific recombinase XerD